MHINTRKSVFPLNKLNFYSLLPIISSYLLLTILMTWPLVLHLDGFLLTKDKSTIYHSVDALWGLSLLSLSCDEITHSYTFICIGHGTSHVFFVLLGMPFILLLNMPIVVYYNLFFLFSVFTTGFFMYLLMLELSKDQVAAYFSGFLYMSSNYIINEYVWGHIHLFQLQWIPLIFLLLERLIRNPRLLNSILLGIVFSIQLAVSEQITMYLTLILPVYLILRIMVCRKGIVTYYPFIKQFFFSIVISLVISIYYIINRIGVWTPTWSISRNLKIRHNLTSIFELSNINSPLYLGILLLFVSIGLIYYYWRENRFIRYIPFVVLIPVLILLMYGPSSVYLPYYWIYHYLPFYDKLRTPKRFFPILMMCFSIISSLVFVWLDGNTRFRKYRYGILVTLLILISLLQILPSAYMVSHHIFYPGLEFLAECVFCPVDLFD